MCVVGWGWGHTQDPKCIEWERWERRRLQGPQEKWLPATTQALAHDTAIGASGGRKEIGKPVY